MKKTPANLHKLANSEVPTHYGEHAVILGVLATVWYCTAILKGVPLHQHWVEALGSLAVYHTHVCGSISSRMVEEQAQQEKPSVPCMTAYWRHYTIKEVLFFLYFLASGAYSALVGCCVFALYPVWRKWYRARYPLVPKEIV